MFSGPSRRLPRLSHRPHCCVSRLALWSLASLLPLGSPSAQWFQPNRPNGTLSPADSLAAFRPDSVDAKQFDRIESGKSAKDTASRKQDSLKQLSSAQLFAKRKGYFALHLGVGFQDLDHRNRFDSDLDARVRERARGRILQPYEPVHLYFPGGLLAGLRLFEYADLMVKSHSFWYRQTGLIGDSLNSAGQEEFFAVQGHLGGVGLRVYVPNAILSAKDKGLLYAELTRFWDLGGNEVYTAHASAPARWDAQGSATEMQLGFMHTLAPQWTWSSALSYMHTGWRSRKRWKDLLKVDDSGPVTWGGNALQLRFMLFFNPWQEPKP